MNNSFTAILLALLVTGFTLYFFVTLYNLMYTPMNSPLEGFEGPAKVGVPDCLQESANASRVYELLSGKQTVEEGPDDLRELTLLLSKTSCFKKDLLSQSGFVEATRYQDYSTAHDIEPVAETTARCLAKTIPERDLDISLEKWSTRGNVLIRKLCTSVQLNDVQVKEAMSKFKAHMDDIMDISKGKCLKGSVEIAGTPGPRDITGYSPPELEELREYKGYY